MEKVYGKIVSVSGYAGSGKDTVGKIFEDEFGYRIVKFAAPLKSMLRALYSEMGCDPIKCDRLIEGDLKESELMNLKSITPRHMMQTLGTEWGRLSLYNNFWVDICQSKCEELLKSGCNVIVTDSRFDNESELMKMLVMQYGGVTLEVTGRGGISGSHRSENVPVCIDKIDNSGTTGELIDKVYEIRNKYKL